MVQSDDDIEIVSEATFNDSFICQVCLKDIGKLDASQRQEHYEMHFTSNYNETSRDTSVKPKTRRKWKDRLPCHNENDMFWYSALKEPPPSNYTPGLVSLLRKGLHKSNLQGQTVRGVVCYPGTVHIRRELWDSSWGCGYRNYLMICSALLSQQTRPEYHSLIINNSRRPGVRNLQILIKQAWDAGFDPEGQQQLKDLVGTSKWIGTADLYVAFTFCGIPCKLVEFDLSNAQKNFDGLINWIVDYFSSNVRPKDVNQALHRASAVTVTDRMPFILQHDGHSRTVVGYEIVRDSTNLLTFDPALTLDSRVRSAAIESSSQQTDTLKRSISESLESPARPESPKRIRSSLHHKEPIDVDIIDDTIATSTNVHIRGGASGFRKLLPSDDKLSLRLLKECRLTPKKLSQKKQYQILYFPMTPPLTDSERAARKVVTSIPIKA
ncbi:peptidase family C78-domain-containing protein [Amanita rubescens]|nr:peptidase family C78-domain-containing protein [Amanita rubescens]